MKLLYITNDISRNGGLERVLSIKASYLADILNYEVYILVTNSASDEVFYDFSPKINIYRISLKGNYVKYSIDYINKIRIHAKKINPNIVLVCDDALKGFFVPLILSKRIPIVYERHASIVLNTKKTLLGNIKKKLMLKLANNFDKFIVLTEGNKLEWKTKNCMVIPNPISFYPNTTSSLAEKRIIGVGSPSYNKGFDLLLKSWIELKKVYPDWELNIFGATDKSQFAINEAKRLHLDVAQIFKGEVKDIEKEYLNSSILVLPSRSEGFGMVLIEAMACGLACVSFDCPSGPRYIIKEGEDGFLVENGSVEQLTYAISRLIENDDLRKKMGLRAKENAKTYLPVNIMPLWDRLFKELSRDTNDI